MKGRLLTVGVVAGVLLLFGAMREARAQAPANANAVEHITATFTDTNVDNDINTTDDPANYSYAANGAGVTGDGRLITFAANVEYGDIVYPPQHCPPSRIEYPFIPDGILVLSFNTGDQLILQINGTAYECGTTATPYTAYTVGAGTVIGGEGKYANASGTWSSFSHGGVVRVDAAGHSFGNDTGTISVNVIRH